ncbi:hypothetical protein BG005_011605 [Podila minutissima]|nr:hypothetical protein BG005_011605 [Podila minutissima]
MTSAFRYPKTCDKAALPTQDAEMIESYIEGNQGQDTFVTYDDGEVHSVLASQPPFQAPLPAHGYVPLVHAPHSQAFPIHGLQAPPPGHVPLAHTPYSQAFSIHGLQMLPPGHVPLVHAPYSQVFPTHGLQAAPPAHFTHTPSLALGSAAAVVTTNQSTLSLASPPGSIPKVPISNLTAIEVANMVNWHVRKANTDGTFWHCTFDGCHSRIKTKGAFKTHLERKHIKTSELPCPVQGCKIKIGYRVDLQRHIDQVHSRIGHYCSCDYKWYSRLETLKKGCSLKDKCPGAIDYRVTGATKKGRGSAPSSKH